MKHFPRFVVALTISALTFPISSITSSGAVTSSPMPECIVSLSPTATESLFAIGAGAQVQAVDKDSNFPTSGLPSKRIDALNPSVEKVLGICKVTPSHSSTKPDLVVISYDANSIKSKLSAAGVKVVEQNAPTSLTGAMAQINDLGSLTGHVASAKALTSSLLKSIAKNVASLPAHPTKVLTGYYELDPTYYSITSKTFVGSLLSSLGVKNIADAKSTSLDAGYPQLSAEYIVKSSPKIMFFADTKCCSVSEQLINHRTGFSKTSAMKNGNFVLLDDDIASRWGPRLSVLMDQLTKGVKKSLNDIKIWK